MSNGILIASPQLQDPYFSRTVILLFDYDEEGALGVVINRQANLSFEDVVKQLDDEVEIETPAPVLHGGPVSINTGFVLFRSAPAFDSARGVIAISENLRISPSLEVLSRASKGELGAHYLLALGHAGWAPGQLDEEIRKGSWIFTELDESLIFETPIEERYDKALAGLGVDPAWIVMRPIDE